MAGGDSLGDESEEGGGVWSRQWAGLAQARRSEEDRRVREDIGLLLRRGGGEGKTGLRGGKGSDDHEVSIPIRVGDGDRAGRRLGCAHFGLRAEPAQVQSLPGRRNFLAPVSL